MANPQLENGHIKIATEIMEHLCTFRIPGEVRQVLDAVMRKTYGWNKKVDAITLTQFADLTGMGKPNISRALSKLITHNIINHDNGQYALQKDIDQWIPFEYKQGGRKLSTTITPPVINHDNSVINHDNELLSTTITTVINHDNALHINQKTLSKDNTKDTISKDTYIVFEHWNLQKIHVHRKLTDEFRRAIKAKLRDYTADELCKAMSNYAEIVLSPAYYFVHRWTIKEFLARGFEKFLDGDIARQNFRTKAPETKGNGHKPDRDPDKFIKGKYAHMVQR